MNYLSLDMLFTGLIIGAALGSFFVHLQHTRERRMQWEMPKTIHDDNPPRYATYTRLPGDLPAHCSCHGTELADEQKILIWPTEHLLCERTYGEDS